jgi:hypothetical protein
MFGDVVCPNLGSFAKSSYSKDFLKALRQPHRGSWKSLSIGDHPFISNKFDSLQEAQERTECVLDNDISALPAVDTLRLRVESSGAEGRSSAVGSPILRRQTSRLQELELDHKHGRRFLSEWGGYEVYLNTHDLARRYVGGDKEPPHDFFRRFLVTRRHEFDHLKILTLRNFIFEQAAMQDLLLGLKSLRTLHILDCVSLGSYEAFLRITREKLSASLHLTGVEIYGLKFFARHLFQTRLDQGVMDKMRIKRNLDFDVAKQFDSLAEFYPFTAGSWPCERPELEAAMMGGRTNNVQRKARAAPNQEARDSWANITVKNF